MIKRSCISVLIIFMLALMGCGAGNEHLNSGIDSQGSIKTPDEAMTFYIEKIEPDRWGQGDYYTGAYKIIDTKEVADKLIIYASVLSEWVDKNGNMVSGGTDFAQITFQKSNGDYLYEKSVSFLPQWISDSSEIPQSVKDKLAIDNESHYLEMRAEMDQQIEDYRAERQGH